MKGEIPVDELRKENEIALSSDSKRVYAVCYQDLHELVEYFGFRHFHSKYEYLDKKKKWIKKVICIYKDYGGNSIILEMEPYSFEIQAKNMSATLTGVSTNRYATLYEEWSGANKKLDLKNLIDLVKNNVFYKIPERVAQFFLETNKKLPWIA